MVVLSVLIVSTQTIAQTPSPPLTRAEAATALWKLRAPTLPPIKNTGQARDVLPGEWHEPFLLLAARSGVLQIDESTKLIRPLDPVNRGEFLQMITLGLGLRTDLPSKFTDVDPYASYAPYAGLAYTYRLFPYDKNQELLEPHRNVTQSEAIVALNRAMKVRSDMFARHGDPHLTEDMEMAKAQSEGTLQLLLVTSTRRTKVVLVDTPLDPTPFQETVALERPPEPQNVTALRSTVANLVNETRVRAGIKPLRYNILLEQSAQHYSDDMADRNYFSHVSPEGQTLRDRIEQSGYYNRAYSAECQCVKGYALGENLARGQKTPVEAVEAWMHSPLHREAMLNGEYDEMGIGVSSGVWVLHFGGVLLPIQG